MGTAIGIGSLVVGLAMLAWATRRVWRGMVTLPRRTPVDRSLRQNADAAEAYDARHPRITKVVMTRNRKYRRPDPDDVES